MYIHIYIHTTKTKNMIHTHRLAPTHHRRWIACATQDDLLNFLSIPITSGESCELLIDVVGVHDVSLLSLVVFLQNRRQVRDVFTST